MTPARHSALEYLRQPRGALWQWADDGRVIAWNDGTTIAFREEIKVIGERLASSGLPSFTEIVLLLAACRNRLPELPPFEPPNQAVAPEKQQLLLAFEARRREQIEPCLTAFRFVANFPPELVKRAAGKALLVEAVLQARPQRTVEDSELIVAGIAEPFTDRELNNPPPDAPPLNLIEALYHVGRGLLAHTPESLLQRIRTGLDALPRAVDATPTLPPDKRARQLLGDLRTDESFAGLALAARDLMAALQLPQLLAHPDELAIGGSADVSNRGSLDRLLISEIVHDDATLAARVALNEALYLQREPPVHRPARSLVLLLDVGIRMWGTPRVLGVAAALALVARHHGHARVTVWRAAGSTVEPVDLLTRAGLEAHLAALRPDAHPGNALPDLARQIDDLAAADLVMLTHRDVLADADFQRAARELGSDRTFAITAERDGAVQLWPLPWATPRPLCEATVDIQNLLTSPRKLAAPAPLIEAREDPDYPAIFRVRPFPLLLPVNAKMEFAEAIGKGGVCVTKDHRVLQWESMQRGARQLATDVPGGRTLWLQPDVEGRVVLVKGRSSDGQMAVVFIPHSGEPPHITRFTGPQHARAIFVDASTLVLVLHTRIVAVSLSTGDVAGETPIEPGIDWIYGRYFRINGELAFACWDGAKVRWDALAVSKTVDGSKIMLAFDRQGIGPWLLLRDGRVLSPTGSEHAKFDFAPINAFLSDDHDTLTAVRSEGQRGVAVMMHVPSRTVSPGSKLPTTGRRAVTPPTRNLQNDFTTIACSGGEPLRLQRRKGKWIEVFSDGPNVRFVESPPLEATLQWQTFSSLTAPPRLGCGLKIARWSDGTRAWLDTRGLLHLRSRNPAIAEISLVLNSGGAIAAWCSDGFRYGPDFFHPEPGAHSPDAARELLSRLMRFVKIPC